MACGCSMQGLGAVDLCQAQLDKVKGTAILVQTNQSILQAFPPGTPESTVAPLRDLYNKSVADMVAAQTDLAKCQAIKPGGSGSTDYTIYYILGGVAVLGVLAYYKTKGRF